MKNFFLFWLIIFQATNSHAQVKSKVNPTTPPIAILDTTTYFGKMEFILSNLDKSKITTGILYDRVFKLAHFEEFTGSGITDTSSSELFIRANYELYKASYNPGTLVSPVTLSSQISHAQIVNGYIPIGIISHAYNELDTLALQSGGLTIVNNKLVETNNGYDIYKTKKLFIAAALTNDNFIPTGSNTYKIDPSISKIEKQISCISIYSDGNHITDTQINTSFTINFTEPKKHLIKIICYYADGEYDTSYSYVVCKSAIASRITANADVSIHIDGLPFDSFQYPGVDPASNQNRSSEGDAAIFFANPANPVLTKPVIFLDGFDPGNSRDYKEIYDEFIEKSGLATQLRQLGYDLVIFDFAEGGGLVERNGMLVIKLLNELHTRYANSLQSDFVVIGPSMGSLVAQYALKKAEITPQYPHHTRTFISFDGIHKGANIPIELQLAYKKVIDLSLFGDVLTTVASAFGKEVDVLNSPAARQMLIHHYATGSESPLPHPFRNTFLENLSSLGGNGYPTLTRNVAITNGASSAFNSIIPNAEFYNFSLRTGVFKRLLVSMNLRTAPNSGRAEVCKLRFRTNLLTVAAGLSGVFTGYSQGDGYSLDALPGSYTATLSESLPKEDKNKYPFYNLKANLWTDKMCFVPSTSAVDLRLNGSNSLVPVYNWTQEDIVCTQKTPFDRVYTPVFSEAHVFVSDVSIDAFKREILGTPLPLTIIAPTVNIQPLVCPNSPTTVSVEHSTAISYTWTFNPSEVRVDYGAATSPYTTTNNSIVVEALANRSTTLEVIANTDCGSSQPSTANIGETTQSLGPISLNQPQPLRTDLVVASINAYPETSNYEWYINGQLLPSDNGTSISFIAGNFLNCGPNRILAVANTPCGAISSIEMTDGDLELLCYKKTSELSLYPNPSRDHVRLGNISKIQAGSTLSFYDSRGDLVLNITDNIDKAINTTFLRPGLYIVKLNSGNQSYTDYLRIE